MTVIRVLALANLAGEKRSATFAADIGQD